MIFSNYNPNSTIVIDVIVLGDDKVRMESDGKVWAEGSSHDMFGKLKSQIFSMTNPFWKGTVQIFLRDAVDAKKQPKGRFGARSADYDLYIARYMLQYNALCRAQTNFNIYVHNTSPLLDKF